MTNYNSFFDLAFSNLDTSNVVANQAALVESIGGNATITLKYFETLRSLIPILSNTPDVNQAAQITQKLTDLIKLTKDLIASFPGMENFETDQTLLIDSKNAAFYELYTQSQSYANDLTLSPSSALEFFSNELVQEKIAELIISAIDVSQRACKLLFLMCFNSSFCFS